MGHMQADVEIPKHRKKATRKPYKIECRYKIGNNLTPWRTWSRYATAADRDKALQTIQANRSNSQIAEYRIAD